jgi:hypothetical protein
VANVLSQRSANIQKKTEPILLFQDRRVTLGSTYLAAETSHAVGLGTGDDKDIVGLS